jgi:DNA-3-methyladenine glycosylase II
MVPTEAPVWGLTRVILAQQMTTSVAVQVANKLRLAYPALPSGAAGPIPETAYIRSLGVPERRAQCCVSVLRNSDSILYAVESGKTWEEALAGIKGIGPWTIAVFKIMVLREPDVLPSGDVGLVRAFHNAYGTDADLSQTAESWKPFRSVACWYLWRSLGNEQLG